MKAKKVTAVVEASSTGFGVYSDQLVGITGYAKSVAEAKKDFESAFQDTLETYKEGNAELPRMFNNGNVEFIYKYDIHSIFEYFGVIEVSAFAKKIGMNASLLRQYKAGLALAGDRQKKKIEEGLHLLGKELINVKL